MFKVDFVVRDYECDLQGVVNNAVYQQYLEHARHQFLQAHGLNFAALTQAGVHLMLTRTELNFKAPLKPDMAFYVTVQVTQLSRLKFEFLQSICLQHTDKEMVQASAHGVAVSEQGKPMAFSPLEKICQPASQE